MSDLFTERVCGSRSLAERGSNHISFNGAKFVKSALNSLIIRQSIIAFVCLDFPEFIAVKMRSTFKPYFLGGCDEDLRRRTENVLQAKICRNRQKRRLKGLIGFESLSANRRRLR